MSSANTELDVLYKIGNAPVREFPYPHIYVPDVFPAAYFAEMRRNQDCVLSGRRNCAQVNVPPTGPNR